MAAKKRRDKLLTAAEVSGILKVSDYKARREIERMAALGVPTYQFGKLIRISENGFRAELENNRIDTAAHA